MALDCLKLMRVNWVLNIFLSIFIDSEWVQSVYKGCPKCIAAKMPKCLLFASLGLYSQSPLRPAMACSILWTYRSVSLGAQSLVGSASQRPGLGPCGPPATGSLNVKSGFKKPPPRHGLQKPFVASLSGCYSSSLQT